MSHSTRIKIAASLTALFVAGLIAAGVATSGSGDAGPQGPQSPATSQPVAAQTAPAPPQDAAPVVPAGSDEIATFEDDDSDEYERASAEPEEEGEDD
jgi:hypothetical protein